jgi:hypothetical protein
MALRIMPASGTVLLYEWGRSWGEGGMKDGFGIVEAVLALFLLMLCAVCVFPPNQACVLSASYGESLCRAGVLEVSPLNPARPPARCARAGAGLA